MILQLTCFMWHCLPHDERHHLWTAPIVMGWWAITAVLAPTGVRVNAAAPSIIGDALASCGRGVLAASERAGGRRSDYLAVDRLLPVPEMRLPLPVQLVGCRISDHADASLLSSAGTPRFPGTPKPNGEEAQGWLMPPAWHC